MFSFLPSDPSLRWGFFLSQGREGTAERKNWSRVWANPGGRQKGFLCRDHWVGAGGRDPDRKPGPGVLGPGRGPWLSRMGGPEATSAGASMDRWPPLSPSPTPGNHELLLELSCNSGKSGDPDSIGGNYAELQRNGQSYTCIYQQIFVSTTQAFMDISSGPGKIMSIADAKTVTDTEMQETLVSSFHPFILHSLVSSFHPFILHSSHQGLRWPCLKVSCYLMSEEYWAIILLSRV